MKCKDLRTELALYADGRLSDELSAAVRDHLPVCPMCRERLSQMSRLKAELREMTRPVLKASELASLRAAVSAAARTAQAPQFVSLEEQRPSGSLISRWFMPVLTGAAASVLLTGSLLVATIGSDFQNGIVEAAAAARRSGSSSVPATGEPFVVSDQTPADYAASRMLVSAESPSINPAGSLAALSLPQTPGHPHENDELVIVADVFGNGLAHIAQVIEPSRSSRSIAELRKALESDPSSAPFVPAKLDGRSEKMRVVLRIQSVNVDVSMQ